jgi:nitrogen fixation protein NifZ
MGTKISRESDIVELVNPPKFDYGEKVFSKKYVRNDGTFPGREVGDILVSKGDVGYVTSIGTFLQQFYIYGIDFYELGYRVGMRGKELEVFEEEDEADSTLVNETMTESEQAHG